MPRGCAAYDCMNASHKRECKNNSFHQFPNDPEIRRQWIIATKRKNYNPGKFAYLCSDHFTLNSFVPDTAKRKLYPNAVPSLFPSLPEYMQPSPKRRPISEQRVISQIQSMLPEPEPSSSHTSSISENARNDASTQTTAGEIQKLEQTVLTLRKKLVESRRRCKVKNNYKLRLIKKVKSLQELISLLENQNLVSKETVTDLRRRFSEEGAVLMAQLLQPGPRPKIYSAEVREFASILFFKSPSAYHFVRRFLQLPGTSTIRSWLSNHGCYPGFTNEVFAELASRINSCDIDERNKYRYCSIIIDEMSLKKMFIGTKQQGVLLDMWTSVLRKKRLKKLQKLWLLWQSDYSVAGKFR